jgi:hypothetical protein
MIRRVRCITFCGVFVIDREGRIRNIYSSPILESPLGSSRCENALAGRHKTLEAVIHTYRRVEQVVIGAWFNQTLSLS